MILKASSLFSELDTQHMICSISERLSFHQRTRWRVIAIRKKGESDNYPLFDDFVVILNTFSAKLCDPIYGSQGCDEHSRSKVVSCVTRNDNGVSYTSGNRKSILKKCILCESPHPLFTYNVFKKNNFSDRLDYVNLHKPCHVCLYGGHNCDKCFSKYVMVDIQLFCILRSLIVYYLVLLIIL